MARARTNVGEIGERFAESLEVLRRHLDPSIPEVRNALLQVEAFAAVSMRVLAKTNPSKIRDAAMIEEIKARVDGRGVIE